MKHLLATLIFLSAIESVANEGYCEPIKDSVFSFLSNGCKQVFLCDKNCAPQPLQSITNYTLKVPIESCFTTLPYHDCSVSHNGGVNIEKLYSKEWIDLTFQSGFTLTRISASLDSWLEITFDGNITFQMSRSKEKNLSIDIPFGLVRSNMSATIISFRPKRFTLTFYGVPEQIKCNIYPQQTLNISNPIKKCLSRNKTMQENYENHKSNLLMYKYLQSPIDTTVTNKDTPINGKGYNTDSTINTTPVITVTAEGNVNEKTLEKSTPFGTVETNSYVSNADLVDITDEYSQSPSVTNYEASGNGVDNSEDNEMDSKFKTTEGFTTIEKTDTSATTVKTAGNVNGNPLEKSTRLVTVETNVRVSSTKLSGSTAKTPTMNCLCPCPKNMTKEESEAWQKELVNELKVDKKTTAKYLATKISAQDDRPSSQVIGGVSIAIMVTIGALICIPDLITLIIFLINKLRQ